MITVSAVFGQEEKALGTLGRVGENETRQIVFDCADILSEYPRAEIICVMQRPCDRTAYLADTVLADNTLTVTLTDADVSASGDLRIELRALVDGKIRKSAVYTGQVVSALRGEEDKPGSPIADVLNRINSTLESAQETKEKLGAALEDAESVIGAANDAAGRAAEAANLAVSAAESANAAASLANRAASSADLAAENAQKATKDAQDVAKTVQEKLDNGEFVGAQGPKGDPGKDGVQINDAATSTTETWSSEKTSAYVAASISALGLSVQDGKLCVRVERE